MIEIAAAAAAITMIKHVLDIIDNVGDKWLNYKETGEFKKPAQAHRMQINVSSDNSNIVAQFGNAPAKIITKEDLERFLDKEDYNT